MYLTANSAYLHVACLEMAIVLVLLGFFFLEESIKLVNLTGLLDTVLTLPSEKRLKKIKTC